MIFVTGFDVAQNVLFERFEIKFDLVLWVLLFGVRGKGNKATDLVGRADVNRRTFGRNVFHDLRCHRLCKRELALRVIPSQRLLFVLLSVKIKVRARCEFTLLTSLHSLSQLGHLGDLEETLLIHKLVV